MSLQFICIYLLARLLFSQFYHVSCLQNASAASSLLLFCCISIIIFVNLTVYYSCHTLRLILVLSIRPTMFNMSLLSGHSLSFSTLSPIVIILIRSFVHICSLCCRSSFLYSSSSVAWLSYCLLCLSLPRSINLI